MSEYHNFNPETVSPSFMEKSFLKKRESQRESGSGSNFFQDNRIRSCSYVKESKGTYKAVPFYDKRDNRVYPTWSTFRKSWTSNVHSNQGAEHAGIGMNKTLKIYDTQAQRNLMDIPDFKPPYPNTSQISVGNRNMRDLKHYVTTYRNEMVFHGNSMQSNNPGIQASKNKWIRSRIQK